MKRVKLVLAAIAVIATAGSAMALRANMFANVNLYRWTGSAFSLTDKFTTNTSGVLTTAPYTLYQRIAGTPVIYTIVANPSDPVRSTTLLQ